MVCYADDRALQPPEPCSTTCSSTLLKQKNREVQHSVVFLIEKEVNTEAWGVTVAAFKMLAVIKPVHQRKKSISISSLCVQNRDSSRELEAEIVVASVALSEANVLFLVAHTDASPRHQEVIKEFSPLLFFSAEFTYNPLCSVSVWDNGFPSATISRRIHWSTNHGKSINNPSILLCRSSRLQDWLKRKLCDKVLSSATTSLPVTPLPWRQVPPLLTNLPCSFVQTFHQNTHLLFCV